MAPSFTLAALSLTTTTIAIPTADSYPAVIPGDGLPSLASLGLTSEGLHKMPRASLRERQDPFTNCDGQTYQAVDATACINYLASLGDTLCNNGTFNDAHELTLCTSGSARLLVHQRAEGAVLTCNDVAISGGHIMDRCTQFGLVAGQNPLNGNGDYIADIALINT